MSRRCARSGGWALRLDEAGEFGEAEALILRVAFGEYLAQLAGGIAMSQGEIVRPHDLGLSEAEIAPLRGGDAARWSPGSARRAPRLAALLAEGAPAAFGRDRARRPDARNDPRPGPPLRRARGRAYAHEWHRADRLIPIEVIDELAGDRRVRHDPARGAWRARPRQDSRCASSPRNCRAPISASARSAPARRSPAS